MTNINTPAATRGLGLGPGCSGCVTNPRFKPTRLVRSLNGTELGHYRPPNVLAHRGELSAKEACVEMTIELNVTNPQK